MNVHFIAIGGSAMHNLAIALHKKGIKVTGSDDEIFEPSRSRLDSYGILPKDWGWFPEKITDDIDAVILGMHARKDNPELIAAQNKKLKIYSYPEYIYEQTKDKKRIVVGGSHGKTTTTSMIMHVLKDLQVDFDYMVGASLEGFDTMVKLTEEAPIVILEGDEYLSSPIDLRPKFHLYHPDIAVITGIAWDHINVFPTFDNYVKQFEIFINKVEPGGTYIYFSGDQNNLKIAMNSRRDIERISYHTHDFSIDNDKLYLLDEGNKYELKIFGEHNLQNLSAALCVCQKIGISKTDFYKSIQSFSGAAKRLQLLKETPNSVAFLDFAHSPSKLRATVEAVKSRYKDRRLIACMELHTFSSLKEDFLPQYKGCMDNADIACVYYNPEVVEHKKLKKITTSQVESAFKKIGLRVYTDSKDMLSFLNEQDYDNACLLLMSSGNFDGQDLKKLAEDLI